MGNCRYRIKLPTCEARYTALGYIGDRLYYVVYTMRGDKCRIISLRKANPREERQYAQA